MIDNEPGRKKFLSSLPRAALGDALGASWEGHRIATEQEIENINNMYMRESFNSDSLRQELLSLKAQNLEEASFEEKAELIARLGVKIIPNEDLKTRRICCRLNLGNTQKREVKMV